MKSCCHSRNRLGSPRLESGIGMIPDAIFCELEVSAVLDQLVHVDLIMSADAQIRPWLNAAPGMSRMPSPGRK